MKNAVVVIFAFLQLNVFAQEITLEDIWLNRKFAQEAVSGFNTTNDGLHYTEIEKAGIAKYAYKDGKLKNFIVDSAALIYNNKKIDVAEFQLNATEDLILILANPEYIYRRSAVYDVYLFDKKVNKITKIDQQKLLHATLSPDGRKIAYVKQNNLFVYEIALQSIKPITTDGKQNQIINGNCDWVYEEEFSFTKAFTWSSNSNYIAYYKFDESNVKEFTFTSFDNLYPSNYTYKYPKAGEDNSKVSIWLYNCLQDKNKKVDIGNEEDIYIPRIKWNDYTKELYIFKLNRAQNKLTIFANTPQEVESKLVYNEDNNAYIDITDNFYFFKNQNLFLYTSEKNGYNQIWIHDNTNVSDAPLINSKNEVSEIVGVDEKKKLIYYTAHTNITEKKLYTVTYDGKTIKCITPEEGTHNIIMGTNNLYFLDNYSSLNIPAKYVLKDNTGKIIKVLKDNAKLANLITASNVNKQEFTQFPNGYGDTLNGWMIKPFKMESGKKYPVLMFQYSGPGSQKVLNNYLGTDYWWYQMLANKGYIIVCADGRGTGGRGEAFKKCTYKQLGNLESDDQIGVAKYLGTLPFVDKDRIGIWGWSYGGFISSICICKGADVFKTAIAVAPVTNWRYYDNIYTERFMGKPQDNAKGYDDNSPVNMVKKMKGNFLLVHGSSDDNVHVQNTMEMIKALIKEGKQYDSEIYPNANHSIPGAKNRYHLYNRITKFILEKL